jgi:hypothetical protein
MGSHKDTDSTLQPRLIDELLPMGFLPWHITMSPGLVLPGKDLRGRSLPDDK